MKKAFYWVSTILQIIFLITAFGIQVFSMKKMGMMRYVVFMNDQWESRYPVTIMKNLTIIFLILFSITIISYMLMKKERHVLDKKVLSMLPMEIIITLVFVFFTLFYRTATFRSYYFTSLILAVIALIQDLKIIVYLK